MVIVNEPHTKRIQTKSFESLSLLTGKLHSKQSSKKRSIASVRINILKVTREKKGDMNGVESLTPY